MTTTATGLRLGNGAVVVPSYREQDMNRDVEAIVAKVAPGENDGMEMEGGESEGLLAAAEDIMAALGQDYGSNPTNADKGQHDAFRDKRDRLIAALKAFIEQC